MNPKRFHEFMEEVKTKGWGRDEALARTIGFLMPYHGDKISANEIRDLLIAVQELPPDKWRMPPTTKND